MLFEECNCKFSVKWRVTHVILSSLIQLWRWLQTQCQGGQSSGLIKRDRCGQSSELIKSDRCGQSSELIKSDRCGQSSGLI